MELLLGPGGKAHPHIPNKTLNLRRDLLRAASDGAQRCSTKLILPTSFGLTREGFVPKKAI